MKRSIAFGVGGRQWQLPSDHFCKWMSHKTHHMPNMDTFP